MIYSTNSKVLEKALFFTIVCHGLALVGTVFLLMPGLPNGSSEVQQRASFIASHATQWRIGWVPWQITALSDLILGIALIRTPWIARLPAWLALGFTITALVFEQPNEYRWTTSGIDIARQAVATGDMTRYLAFESEIFRQTSLWAAMFYTFAAIFWSIALAKAGAWNRLMTILSVVLWSLLLVISLGPLLIPTFNLKIISFGNAIGFAMMMGWFILAVEMVMRKFRPHGTFAQEMIRKIQKKA